MRFSFLIVDKDPTVVSEMMLMLQKFPNYFCAGVISEGNSVIEKIYELKPQLVFIGLPFDEQDAELTFVTMLELQQYSEVLPYFIALAKDPQFALEAIQSGFSDYCFKPMHLHLLGKCLSKFEKRNPTQSAATICIKSYSDYHFVALQDIVYLKADGNTTDIKLDNDKIVNANKTLKFFENTLPFYFLRIHKSFIVNINHVSRIHFSKSKCYMNYKEMLPYSESYKKNIDAIVRRTKL